MDDDLNPTADPSSCADFRRAEGVSRRALLRSMTAVGAGAAVTSSFGGAFRQVAFAEGTAQRILVVVSLRGGIDGLGLVVPHGDPGYYAARPTLAVPKAALLRADAMFGLHPDLAPLSWMWTTASLRRHTPSGCRRRPAPTSRRWRPSRTPTPGARSGPAG